MSGRTPLWMPHYMLLLYPHYSSPVALKDDVMRPGDLPLVQIWFYVLILALAFNNRPA